MLAAALVTLKQHRFEVGAAAIAAFAVGLWALLLVLQLGTVALPPECRQAWAAAGPDDLVSCGGLLQKWTEIVSGAPVIAMVANMALAIGVVAGVPIVARELESRTAQTAWSFFGSRPRWLLRQLAPVLILLGAGLTFAAGTTNMLEPDRVLVGLSPVDDLRSYGPLIIVRALGAFGIGLLVGAVLGRTLPAFIVSVAVAVALVFLVSSAREAWTGRLEPAVVAESSPAGGTWFDPRAVITGVA